MEPTFDSKYYDFQTTACLPNSPLNPPPGEKWIYVQTVSAGTTFVTIWARRKEVRPVK